jgi:hypothetical protein
MAIYVPISCANKMQHAHLSAPYSRAMSSRDGRPPIQYEASGGSLGASKVNFPGGASMNRGASARELPLGFSDSVRHRVTHVKMHGPLLMGFLAVSRA